ncbi:MULTISPECIES: hypothetical protein [unclassified Paracoccus (in: a-proteobacteria)]|uniref:hypothetical protein n=1 Tax=unclassified Paracoccus (in: a-proteobacteria) TaxID=2688777 RepID=UPI0015FF708C|nr:MULTISPECIES: hypothetical protein [unclassified Paracoccus (in: a-proteobacteria)]MBB1491942.1 hypothetical protein [Paracoccus sp. MC1854]MBB1498195.1 hypothetical protein [Paracoccus sp. MC1862]QQO45692.1 hypothetical protein JGR78_04940 [Paracoccus sp. MC1862]
MDLRALFLNDRVAAALVTALVGGGVVAAGWFWTHALSRRRDRQLRDERVSDIQRALLAEIRAHVAALEGQTLDDPQAREAMVARFAAGGHVPILPHDANDRIFRAIVEDVHILPEWAIDPVVRYYRLLAVRGALAQDIRATKDQPERATDMFRDYLTLNDETLVTGQRAMIVLTASLQGGRETVEALLAAAQQREAARITSTLPGELARLRAGLSKRSSDPRGP